MHRVSLLYCIRLFYFLRPGIYLKSLCVSFQEAEHVEGEAASPVPSPASSRVARPGQPIELTNTSPSRRYW